MYPALSIIYKQAFWYIICQFSVINKLCDIYLAHQNVCRYHYIVHHLQNYISNVHSEMKKTRQITLSIYYYLYIRKYIKNVSHKLTLINFKIDIRQLAATLINNVTLIKNETVCLILLMITIINWLLFLQKTGFLMLCDDSCITKSDSNFQIWQRCVP